VLRSTELLGAAGEPTVLLVNIAPRDGHWPNGVPFCHFRHRGQMVISTLNPRVLEPLRRHLGLESVQVTDVADALRAAAGGWAAFDQAEVERIADTQFRSLWYVPLLARWLVDGRPVPARTESLAELAAAAGLDGAQAVARIAVVDNFGNCKLDLAARRLPGYAGSGAVAVFDRRTGERREVRCYPRLVDVPHGEPGVITGSSGLDFAELVVRGGSAAGLFELREGDAPFAPAAAEAAGAPAAEAAAPRQDPQTPASQEPQALLAA
jgi:hypothetical protein